MSIWPSKNARANPKTHVDMDALADRMEAFSRSGEFHNRLKAEPPMGRGVNPIPDPVREAERAIETIEQFGALPLKQIDDQMTTLRTAMAETEKLGQEIRDLIMRVRADYLDTLAKSQLVAQLTQENFARLAEQIASIQMPDPAMPATQEPTKETETDEQLQPKET